MAMSDSTTFPLPAGAERTRLLRKAATASYAWIEAGGEFGALDAAVSAGPGGRKDADMGFDPELLPLPEAA